MVIFWFVTSFSSLKPNWRFLWWVFKRTLSQSYLFFSSQWGGNSPLANQNVENEPEFSYLSAFLPFFFSSLIKTKSIASPFATRSFNSLNVVAQEPISFDLNQILTVPNKDPIVYPFLLQWLTEILSFLSRLSPLIWLTVIENFSHSGFTVFLMTSVLYRFKIQAPKNTVIPSK